MIIITTTIIICPYPISQPGDPSFSPNEKTQRGRGDLRNAIASYAKSLDIFSEKTSEAENHRNLGKWRFNHYKTIGKW
jgi:hypothetical protein